jgi:hypothetical protein
MDGEDAAGVPDGTQEQFLVPRNRKLNSEKTSQARNDFHFRSMNEA